MFKVIDRLTEKEYECKDMYELQDRICWLRLGMPDEYDDIISELMHGLRNHEDVSEQIELLGIEIEDAGFEEWMEW